MGWPPCWHGLHNLNAKLGLTPSKVGHLLAQKFVELGGGFLKGQRYFLENNLNVIRLPNGVKRLLVMNLWIKWEVHKEPNPSHIRWRGMALGREFV